MSARAWTISELAERRGLRHICACSDHDQRKHFRFPFLTSHKASPFWQPKQKSINWFYLKASFCTMFKRGGLISRSLHAPRGVNIHGVSKQPLGPAASKIKRKFSWASSRVRGAVSESALTHRQLVLKEGFLYKPGFLRIVR